MRTKPNKYPRLPLSDPAGTPTAPSPQGKLPGETAREIGGPKGPEPTRYGDWEVGGRCTDF